MRRYAEILRTPGVAGPVFATVLARFPIGLNGLAILLFVQNVTGSFGIAGVATGALALGVAVGAPVQGRLVDRAGRALMVPMAVGHAAALATLWVLGTAGASPAILVALPFLAGLGFPPTSAVLRSLWPRLLRDRPDLVSSAYALDSVMIEVIFILGPLAVAAIVVAVGPQAALGVSAACVLAGTTTFVAQLVAVDERRTAHDERHFLGALASDGVRTLVLSTFPVGFCFGATEVALPAFSEAKGSEALAGVLIAVLSAASVAGGLLYGARPWRTPLPELHLRLAMLLPIAFLPVLAAWSIPAMAVLVIPAGAVIAPLLASRNELVGRVAPPGAATEAFTWPLMALTSGIALGSGLAGVLVEGEGWEAAALAAAVAAALGAAVVAARRRTLLVPAPA
jgi:MFS family permease